MSARTRAENRLKMKKGRLAMYYEAEEAILGGAQSYTIGSRQLSRASLSAIQDAIKALEDEVADLEELLSGQKPRRMAAIVPRDY